MRAFGVAASLLFASVVTACLSSSNGTTPTGRTADASADGGPPTTTTGGNVGADGGDDDGGLDGGAGDGEAGAAPGSPHQGFGIVAGGVRSTSSAHVLITTTGQAPGGNATMHSSAHTVVGGVVGGTQQP